jgi:hypothetical protein
MSANPRCEGCNRFMSWNDVAAGVEYTPFGGALDLEPPDPRNLHAACWDAMPAWEQALTRRIAYIGPHGHGTEAMR